jgi:DNA-binding MarR family transcriptional regulator
MNADSLPLSQRDTFAQVPILLILDSRLSDGAIRLYAYMQWRAGQNSRNFEGRDSIAEAMGISETTVTKRAAELEAADWIVIIRRRNKTGKSTNFYKVFDSQDDCCQWRAKHQLPKPQRQVRARKTRAGVGGRPHHKPDLDGNVNSSSEYKQDTNINLSSETNVNLSSGTPAQNLNSSLAYPDSVFIQTQIDPSSNTPDGGLSPVEPPVQESPESEVPKNPSTAPKELPLHQQIFGAFKKVLQMADNAEVPADSLIGRYSSWLAGNAVKRYRGKSDELVPGCAPPSTAREVEAFLTEWVITRRLSLSPDAVTFSENFYGTRPQLGLLAADGPQGDSLFDPAFQDLSPVEAAELNLQRQLEQLDEWVHNHE